MNSWKPGDRVEQVTYGHGTVLEANDQHVVVHFDTHGRRKFAAHLATLKESAQPDPSSSSRTTGFAQRSQAASVRKTTDPGFENANQQRVIRQTSLPGQVAGQRVYVLLCGRCNVQYGAAPAEIESRRCPYCMGGHPGLNFKG